MKDVNQSDDWREVLRKAQAKIDAMPRDVRMLVGMRLVPGTVVPFVKKDPKE